MKLVIDTSHIANKRSILIDILVTKYNWINIDYADETLKDKLNNPKLKVVLLFNYNKVYQLSHLIDLSIVKVPKICYMESLVGNKRVDNYDIYSLILSPFPFELAKLYLRENINKYHQIPYTSDNNSYSSINQYPISTILKDDLSLCRKHLGTIYNPIKIIKDKTKYHLYQPEIFDILNAGSLLILNPICVNSFTKLGFIENKHYLVSSDKNIEFIENPKNRGIIDCIRKSGCKYYLENHNIDSRAEYLNRIIIAKI
jgi:hypothetical protein